jgi:hypothetical protein
MMFLEVAVWWLFGVEMGWWWLELGSDEGVML